MPQETSKYILSLALLKYMCQTVLKLIICYKSSRPTTQIKINIAEVSRTIRIHIELLNNEYYDESVFVYFALIFVDLLAEREALSSA